ncbi:uncharacterized protein [Cicer arietinum]|uniref:Receptor-like protein kinase HSL1 n=1 Tax=Cicer arietinum TaxID=3827 RepID=A0A3Q7YH53_CICAR|nr:receptor-like protein kinase HSL1 [Cicer arietinum]
MKKSNLFSFHYLLTIFLIILIHAKSQSHYNLHDEEHETLMKLKQHFENPSKLTHWISSNTSHCSWQEIICTNGSITQLNLFDTNINQTIPPFICDLKNLTHVDFNNNFIPGMFPTYLNNCSKLEYLDLSMNNFIGKIPDEIFTFSNLKYLNLSYNNLTDDIPKSIGRMKELRFLALQACLFNGTYPDEIGNLLNLETLDLSSNSMFLPSKLPMNWTKLSKLKVFYMYDCNLFGEMPEPMGKMASLEKLDVSQNGLTGKIPSGLFMLKNLSILFLSRNNLSGEIPSLVEALNLTIIDLTRNRLTGKIPDDFGKLQKLTGLALSMNNLSGKIPQSIGNLPSLIDFKVFMNNLSGTLPSNFGLYSKLGTFLISSNSFSGRLPENLCYHGELLNLAVYENHLSGELPESLGNCSSLVKLKVYNNEFYGKIPSGLWNINLVDFMVSHNKFTGELPQNLSSSITLFDISYNQFYGEIPNGVSSWTNVVEFIASKNFLNGSIPQELTNLFKLEKLLLDQNQLKGSLPFDVTSWKSLVFLNLSQNQLNGEIPVSIGHLPSLGVLDVSENQFSGQIPSVLPRITVLNLSSNHLTGRVPSEFENSAYDRSFLNNSGLCADTEELSLTLCNSKTQGQSKDSSLSPTLIIILVVVSTLVVLLISFIIIKIYGKRKRGSDDYSWKLTSFQRLNFTESDIVSSMTENNVIGSGGYGKVYRVAVDGLGYIAVKKIWEKKKLDHNLEKSFHTEVKILSSIRHRNIVKLLCCISNEDTMLLVYEYVENRSLDRWLHKKSMKSSNVSSSVHHVVLDWTKRLQIAIGIAQGLSYMHHECSPPVVHRDVKTSNILLDSQFNAKVADFGLARMLIKPGELATMSAVIGSFGYMAPEYVQTTRVSEKIDVFSFGVILLELTTGKEANYGDEHSSLAEWSWCHIQAGSNIEELLDKEVMESSHLNGMCKVFKLGVMCTSTLPSSRPSMKEVLEVLLNCGELFAYGERNIVGHNVNDGVPLLRNSKRECKLDIDDNDS